MTATIFLRLARKLARESWTGPEDKRLSREKMLQGLYNREWLMAIGRDPCHFTTSPDIFFGAAGESSVDDADVAQPEWGDHVFDLIRNTVRIGPLATVYLGE